MRPPLHVNIGASVSPTTLPRRERVPVALRLFLKVKTYDGTHPSALREAVLDFDPALRWSPRGLPACGWRRLDRRSRRAATGGCRSAIIGRGEAHVEVSPESDVVPVAVTAFSGGMRPGGAMLFLHLAAPDGELAPTVARVKLARRGGEEEGAWRARLLVPRIADGLGSLLDLKLAVERRFGFRGQRRSYLSARCPDGKLVMRAPKLVFRNEAEIPHIAPRTIIKGGFLTPCTSRRRG